LGLNRALLVWLSDRTLRGSILPPADRGRRLGRRLRSFLFRPSRGPAASARIKAMEITWYGQTCVRLRGRDAVVVADAYQSIVGPTGRGITADIATYSHADDAPLARAKGRRTRDGKTVLPSSLEATFTVDGPGEYEVKDVLLTGV